MLTIRLARQGRKNVRTFRIVVSEKIHHPKRGNLAILGYYNPETEPYTLVYDKAELAKYLKNGAIPSETLARLFHKAGEKGMERYYDAKKKYNQMTKDPEKLEAMKQAEEAKNAPAPAPVAEAPAETPAEEKPADVSVEASQSEPKAEDTPQA